MNLWRLELARLVRTRRLYVLLGVDVLFGFLGPVSTRYLEQIIKAFGGTGDAQIVFPKPTVLAGMQQFTGNAAQIGTLVLVVVAAGAVSLDAIPEMGVFLRTRVPSVATLLAPRIVVSMVAGAAAYAAGTLAAAYEAVILLGPVPWGSLTLGLLLTFVGLAFVVALVALVAQRMRGTLGTVMLSLGVLIALPIFSLIPQVGRYLPTRLLGAVSDLVGQTTFSDLLPATLIALGLTVGCWWLAVVAAKRREI